MLLRNAIQTPDGTILESHHRHDYKTHLDTLTNKLYGVDGGLAYIRHIGDIQDCIDLSVESDDHEVIRTHLTWETYGKSGKNPPKVVPVCELSNNHIEAIITTQTISEKFLTVLLEEIKYRNTHDINIAD